MGGFRKTVDYPMTPLEEILEGIRKERKKQSKAQRRKGRPNETVVYPSPNLVPRTKH